MSIYAILGAAGRNLIRQILIATIRLLMTAGLLWALAARLDLARVEEIAGHVSLPFLAAAVAALFAALPANAVRWRMILAAEGPAPKLGNLMKLLFVGLFFNQVLPTGIGGDAVRAWRCRRLDIAFGTAVRSVFLDRVSGYLVMVAVYVATLPVLLEIFSGERLRISIIMILSAALVGLAALFLMDFLPRWLSCLPILSALSEMSRETRRLFARPGRFSAILALSVVTVGLTILAYMFVGDSLGIPLSYGGWLLVVPLLGLIQLLPISLAGWGVREAGMVVILGGFGVPAEAALATSLLVGLALLVVGLPGGLIWFTDWDVARPRTADGLARRGLVE